MIPRIIHQVWIGKEHKKPTKLMRTWKRMNPSCTYIQWTEKELKNFDFINQKQIDDMDSLHGKVAIMRYEILYRYGGIYVDADSECINTLDDFFFENDRFTCYENEINGRYCGLPLLAMGYMGCGRFDDLMLLCIGELKTRNMKNRPAHVFCGNLFFATMVRRWKDVYPTKIYPSWYFIPKHGTGVEYKGKDKVYSRHYWGSTFGIYGEL